jgi:predicted nucleic acid-binding protein
LRTLVLDTNVVLDWLVFRNPSSAPLAMGLASGQWQWLVTRAMRDEFAHVIARADLARWTIDAAAAQAQWDRRAVECDPPAALGETERLRCTDPDDQKFIDLAIARRAAALLTRDRAVLRLAARARGLGVLIATPERWNAWAAAVPDRAAQACRT